MNVQSSGSGSVLALLLLVLAAAGLIPACATSTRPAPPDQAAADARASDARKLFVEANEARNDGKNDEAIDLYRRSLGLDGTNAAAWNNLGTLLIERGEYMHAASALRSAADLSPADPRPLENLGLAYFRAGYDDDALRFYIESLQRDPNFQGSIRGVALCSQRLNRATEQILEILGRGVMSENDPAWRQTIQRERIRVEQQLKAEKEAARREGR